MPIAVSPARSRPSLPVIRVAVAVAILGAGGCSVRDERAVGGGDATWWTTETGESRAGLIGESPAHLPTAAIEYEESFSAATRRAADTGRPTLLVFRAAWCRWSGDLLSAAAGDPRIVARARRCVCCAVDADRDPETCRKFAVRAFPTVILLDAAGEEQFRRTGATATGPLADALDDVLSTGRRMAAETAPSRR